MITLRLGLIGKAETLRGWKQKLQEPVHAFYKKYGLLVIT